MEKEAIIRELVEKLSSIKEFTEFVDKAYESFNLDLEKLRSSKEFSDILRDNLVRSYHHLRTNTLNLCKKIEEFDFNKAIDFVLNIEKKELLKHKYSLILEKCSYIESEDDLKDMNEILDKLANFWNNKDKKESTIKEIEKIAGINKEIIDLSASFTSDFKKILEEEIRREE